MLEGPRNKESSGAVFACALAVILFTVLYSLRALDDNRLTGWRWVFLDVNATSVYLAVCVSALIAFVLSRRALPGPRVLAAVAFLAGAAFWPVPEVIVDSSRYFTQAKHLSVYGTGFFLREWGGAIEPWTDMPLMPMLYGLGFRLFEESRLVVQVVNTSMFAGSVWLAALSASELFQGEGEEDAGPLAGVLMLSMPYLYSQVPLMLVDVPSMFLLALGFFSFQRALTRGGAGYVLLASAAIFLMLMAKYSMWLFATVFGVMALVRLRKEPAAALRRGVAVAIVSGTMFAAFLFAFRDVIASQMDLLTSYQKPGLRRWTEGFISTFFFQVHPFVSLGAGASVFLALRRKDARVLPACWLVLLVLGMRIERSRYLVPLLPMLAITASYGFCALRDVRTRRATALLAMMCSLAIAFFAYSPFLRSYSLANPMEAGRFLDRQGISEVRVYTFPQKSTVNPAVAVPLLDLYTSARIIYEYDPSPVLEGERLRRSPLRFTWTYRNPPYYDAGGGDRLRHAVVVSFWPEEENARRLPVGSELIRRFDASEGIFRFKPYISIYELPGG
jgi:hypothetical protein